MNDTELLELLPLLEDLSKVNDVVPYLATARMNGYRKPSA
jgi:TFIIF-interacting CTD phosphatase-like protein